MERRSPLHQFGRPFGRFPLGLRRARRTRRARRAATGRCPDLHLGDHRPDPGRRRRDLSGGELLAADRDRPGQRQSRLHAHRVRLHAGRGRLHRAGVPAADDHQPGGDRWLEPPQHDPLPGERLLTWSGAPGRHPGRYEQHRRVGPALPRPRLRAGPGPRRERLQHRRRHRSRGLDQRRPERDDPREHPRALVADRPVPDQPRRRVGSGARRSRRRRTHDRPGRPAGPPLFPRQLTRQLLPRHDGTCHPRDDEPVRHPGPGADHRQPLRRLFLHQSVDRRSRPGRADAERSRRPGRRAERSPEQAGAALRADAVPAGGGRPAGAAVHGRQQLRGLRRRAGHRAPGRRARRHVYRGS